MPPVFEQPGGNRGSSGGDHYAQLASSLQSRYASDAATQLHAQLGYAQLDQQRLAQQQNFDLQVAHLQLQPILQEQQGRQQLDNWMAQQQFTQRDKEEMNRQNSLVSELLDKHAKGEISDGELYAKAREVAPYANMLQAKEQHTANAALEEQRKQKAANFQDLIKMRDRAAAYQQGELEGKTDLWIPPRYSQRLSELMAEGHPDLKSGTPEYDAQLKATADEKGWAVPCVKDKAGTPIFKHELQAYFQSATGEGGAPAGQSSGRTAGRAGGNELDAAHVNSAYQSAREHVLKLSKEKKDDGTPAHPELQDEEKYGARVTKEFNAQVAATSEHFGKGKADTEKTYKDALTSVAGAKDLFQSEPSFSPQLKAYADQTVSEARRLMEKFPPGERTRAITAKINALVDRIEQLKHNADAANPKKAAPPAATTEGGTSLADNLGAFGRVGNWINRNVPNASQMGSQESLGAGGY